MLFIISRNHNISTISIFRVLQLHSRGRQTYAIADFFCPEFNSEQHLFEPFFNAMRIFSSAALQSKSTFLFFYIVLFQRWISFEPLASLCGGDRHMRSQTFLYEIQLRTTFIRSFFFMRCVFLAVISHKWKNSCIFRQPQCKQQRH